MARNFELLFPATSFIGDGDAQLAAGDLAATPVNHLGRPALAFDAGANEEAATSVEFEWPDGYTGSGTTKATIHFAMASDATNDIEMGVYVEAKTPGTDTLDMEAASSWDSANTGTVSLSGTTAGDPLALTITLSNKGSVAPADLVRIGIRRNTQSANDDASGDLFVYSVTLFEEV